MTTSIHFHISSIFLSSIYRPNVRLALFLEMNQANGSACISVIPKIIYLGHTSAISKDI